MDELHLEQLPVEIPAGVELKRLNAEGPATLKILLREVFDGETVPGADGIDVRWHRIGVDRRRSQFKGKQSEPWPVRHLAGWLLGQAADQRTTKEKYQDSVSHRPSPSATNLR